MLHSPPNIVMQINGSMSALVSQSTSVPYSVSGGPLRKVGARINHTTLLQDGPVLPSNVLTLSTEEGGFGDTSFIVQHCVVSILMPSSNSGGGFTPSSSPLSPRGPLSTAFSFRNRVQSDSITSAAAPTMSHSQIGVSAQDATLHSLQGHASSGADSRPASSFVQSFLAASLGASPQVFSGSPCLMISYFDTAAIDDGLPQPKGLIMLNSMPVNPRSAAVDALLACARGSGFEARIRRLLMPLRVSLYHGVSAVSGVQTQVLSVGMPLGERGRATSSFALPPLGYLNTSTQHLGHDIHLGGRSLLIVRTEATNTFLSSLYHVLGETDVGPPPSLHKANQASIKAAIRQSKQSALSAIARGFHVLHTLGRDVGGGGPPLRDTALLKRIRRLLSGYDHTKRGKSYLLTSKSTPQRWAWETPIRNHSQLVPAMRDSVLSLWVRGCWSGIRQELAEPLSGMGKLLSALGDDGRCLQDCLDEWGGGGRRPTSPWGQYRLVGSTPPQPGPHWRRLDYASRGVVSHRGTAQREAPNSADFFMRQGDRDAAQRRFELMSAEERREAAEAQRKEEECAEATLESAIRDTLLSSSPVDDQSRDFTEEWVPEIGVDDEDIYPVTSNYLRLFGPSQAIPPIRTLQQAYLCQTGCAHFRIKAPITDLPLYRLNFSSDDASTHHDFAPTPPFHYVYLAIVHERSTDSTLPTPIVASPSNGGSWKLVWTTNEESALRLTVDGWRLPLVPPVVPVRGDDGESRGDTWSHTGGGFARIALVEYPGWYLQLTPSGIDTGEWKMGLVDEPQNVTIAPSIERGFSELNLSVRVIPTLSSTAVDEVKTTVDASMDAFVDALKSFQNRRTRNNNDDDEERSFCRQAVDAYLRGVAEIVREELALCVSLKAVLFVEDPASGASEAGVLVASSVPSGIVFGWEKLVSPFESVMPPWAESSSTLLHHTLGWEPCPLTGGVPSLMRGLCGERFLLVDSPVVLEASQVMASSAESSHRQLQRASAGMLSLIEIEPLLDDATRSHNRVFTTLDRRSLVQRVRDCTSKQLATLLQWWPGIHSAAENPPGLLRAEPALSFSEFTLDRLAASNRMLLLGASGVGKTLALSWLWEDSVSVARSAVVGGTSFLYAVGAAQKTLSLAVCGGLLHASCFVTDLPGTAPTPLVASHVVSSDIILLFFDFREPHSLEVLRSDIIPTVCQHAPQGAHFVFVGMASGSSRSAVAAHRVASVIELAKSLRVAQAVEMAKQEKAHRAQLEATLRASLARTTGRASLNRRYLDALTVAVKSGGTADFPSKPTSQQVNSDAIRRGLGEHISGVDLAREERALLGSVPDTWSHWKIPIYGADEAAGEDSIRVDTDSFTHSLSQSFTHSVSSSPQRSAAAAASQEFNKLVKDAFDDILFDRACALQGLCPRRRAALLLACSKADAGLPPNCVPNRRVPFSFAYEWLHHALTVFGLPAGAVGDAAHIAMADYLQLQLVRLSEREARQDSRDRDHSDSDASDAESSSSSSSSAQSSRRSKAPSKLMLHVLKATTHRIQRRSKRREALVNHPLLSLSDEPVSRSGKFASSLMARSRLRVSHFASTSVAATTRAFTSLRDHLRFDGAAGTQAEADHDARVGSVVAERILEWVRLVDEASQNANSRWRRWHDTQLVNLTLLPYSKVSGMDQEGNSEGENLMRVLDCLMCPMPPRWLLLRWYAASMSLGTIEGELCHRRSLRIGGRCIGLPCRGEGGGDRFRDVDDVLAGSTTEKENPTAHALRLRYTYRIVDVANELHSSPFQHNETHDNAWVGHNLTSQRRVTTCWSAVPLLWEGYHLRRYTPRAALLWNQYRTEVIDASRTQLGGQSVSPSLVVGGTVCAGTVLSVFDTRGTALYSPALDPRMEASDFYGEAASLTLEGLGGDINNITVKEEGPKKSARPPWETRGRAVTYSNVIDPLLNRHTQSHLGGAMQNEDDAAASPTPASLASPTSAQPGATGFGTNPLHGFFDQLSQRTLSERNISAMFALAKLDVRGRHASVSDILDDELGSRISRKVFTQPSCVVAYMTQLLDGRPGGSPSSLLAHVIEAWIADAFRVQRSPPQRPTFTLAERLLGTLGGEMQSSWQLGSLFSQLWLSRVQAFPDELLAPNSIPVTFGLDSGEGDRGAVDAARVRCNRCKAQFHSVRRPKAVCSLCEKGFCQNCMMRMPVYQPLPSPLASFSGVRNGTAAVNLQPRSSKSLTLAFSRGTEFDPEEAHAKPVRTVWALDDIGLRDPTCIQHNNAARKAQGQTPPGRPSRLWQTNVVACCATCGAEWRGEISKPASPDERAIRKVVADQMENTLSRMGLATSGALASTNSGIHLLGTVSIKLAANTNASLGGGDDDAAAVARWANDTSESRCPICSRPFTLMTRRRHHCRSCGTLCCGACSKYTQAVSGYKEEQRVCKTCKWAGSRDFSDSASLVGELPAAPPTKGILKSNQEAPEATPSAAPPPPPSLPLYLQAMRDELKALHKEAAVAERSGDAVPASLLEDIRGRENALELEMRLHVASEKALLMDRYIGLYLFASPADIHSRRRPPRSTGRNSSADIFAIRSSDDEGRLESSPLRQFEIPIGHDRDIDYTVRDEFDSSLGSVVPPSTQQPTPTATPRSAYRQGPPTIGWAEQYDSDEEDSKLIERMRRLEAEGGYICKEASPPKNKTATAVQSYKVMAVGYAFADDAVEDAEASAAGVGCVEMEPDVWVRGGY